MLKKTLLIIIFMFLISDVSAFNYVINTTTDTVYYDGSNAYVGVSPVTLKRSGVVKLNALIKPQSNTFKFALGFNNSADNYGIVRNAYYYGLINGSKHDWLPMNVSQVNYSFDDKNTWFVIGKIDITKSVLYNMTIDVDIKGSGKYDYGAFLSSLTLEQAIVQSKFYYVDPWWNETTSQTNATTTCTNNGWTSISNTTRTTAGYNFNGGLRAGFPFESFMTEGWFFENSMKDEMCRYDGSTNGTYVNGVIGYAMNFTGSSPSRASLGDVETIDGATALTVAFWIKPSALADFKGIWEKSVGNNDRIGIGMSGSGYGDNNDIFFNCANGANTWGTTASNILGVNSWTHIGLVYNGAGANDTEKVKIYANGSQIPITVQASPYPSSLDSNSAHLYLGFGNAYYNNIVMDNFKILNTSLSSSQMATLFSSEYNTSATYFYSVTNSTNNTNSINSLINSSIGNPVYRVSYDDGTSFTPWLNNSFNVVNVSINNGSLARFEINLSGTNNTYSPDVVNFGINRYFIGSTTSTSTFQCSSITILSDCAISLVSDGICSVQ